MTWAFMIITIALSILGICIWYVQPKLIIIDHYFEYIRTITLILGAIARQLSVLF